MAVSAHEWGRRVPEISRFFGIVIFMYARAHGAAHFDARYGEHWASVEIERETIRGYLPRRARKMVLEWARLHRPKLLENWHRARAENELIPIAPLE